MTNLVLLDPIVNVPECECKVLSTAGETSTPKEFRAKIHRCNFKETKELYTKHFLNDPKAELKP